MPDFLVHVTFRYAESADYVVTAENQEQAEDKATSHALTFFTQPEFIGQYVGSKLLADGDAPDWAIRLDDAPEPDEGDETE